MTCFSLAIRMLLHMTLGGKAINPKKKTLMLMKLGDLFQKYSESTQWISQWKHTA